MYRASQAQEELGRHLFNAAEDGHTEIVETFLENGADVNHANKNGWTALHIAAYYDKGEIISIINRLHKNNMQSIQQSVMTPKKWTSARETIL